MTIRFLDTRDKTEIDNNISLLASRIDDLEYLPIAIISFAATPSLAETGSTVTTLDLSFVLNKSANDILLNGISQGSDWGDNSTIRLVGLSLRTDTTYALTVTDERGHMSEKSAALLFRNGAYYGAGNPASIDNAFILSLTKVLTGSSARTISVNAGTGQYIWYAIPARFGTPTFTVGGFTGGFTLLETMDFTNASGYTESYNVYRSDNTSLGDTTIVIS